MLGNYDGLQARVSDRTADESDLAHPGKTQIGDILALAIQESLIFFSLNSSTDSGLHEACFRCCEAGEPSVIL
jgi:hypothetical protein